MSATDAFDQPLLRAILTHVLRTEAIALEGLVLQARVHNGLLGGDTEELVQSAEKRAYQRSEAMMQQLLKTPPQLTADS